MTLRRDWVDTESDEELAACLGTLDPSAPEDYRQLASMLAIEWRGAVPRRVGLGGGQGVGKSTLGRLIEAACAFAQLRVCVLSIDDFYLSKASRRALAERVHPLFETRGPPGTHDLASLREAMNALGREGAVALPVFDKARDDRAGFREVEGPFDAIVLEGWCVGARSLDAQALGDPINDLEATCDPKGIWRRFMAERLARDYQPLWETLDSLILLRVPNLDCVRRWRLEQEIERPEALRMGAVDVDRFVQHYERVTLAMAEQPARSGQWTVELGEAHEVLDVSRSGS